MRIDGDCGSLAPIEPTVVAALRGRLAERATLSADDALEVMRDSYRNYVRYSTPSFRVLFAHLVEDHAPLVIHCTAGKDRTGFACALILHALGVPDDLIAEDYLLTNRFYRRGPAGNDLPDDVGQVLGSVETSFLAAAFDTVSADYGDLETYLSDGLGVDDGVRARLQARYLES
jgi:protein-tyrosine phosphatase